MNTPWQLIILDRDGVINQDSDDYIKSVDEWHALPGSLEAIATVNQQNSPVVLCTNQSGVGRGLFDEPTLHAIHDKLTHQLETHGGHVDNIYYCPHTPQNNCDCRKPKAAMYLQALSDFQATPEHTLVVGDSLRDLQAAQTAGCQAVLVKTGKGKRTLEKAEGLNNIAIYNDLADVVTQLIPV